LRNTVVSDGALVAGKFDLAKFADRYKNALIALIRKKQARPPTRTGRRLPRGGA
jgi:non-homologous end joining protein Ku